MGLSGFFLGGTAAGEYSGLRERRIGYRIV